MASNEDITHQMISSLFIGPRAENLDHFRGNISSVLDELQFARKRYFHEDAANGYDFIPQSVQDSPAFKHQTARVSRAVRQAARMLGQHSIPFWSPRYQAHMCTDLTMPSLLGYFMTMLYNPNNVAVEASPLSTIAEIEVGEQLCDLFGFDKTTSWGHVTCDGTVANLEAIWVARNLKFYPLSLKKAIDDGTLGFLPEQFGVRTCQGKLKKFRDLSNWELLNLKPKTVLDIPERLYKEYGITPTFLQGALDKYNIQTTGKDVMEKDFGLLEKPGQFFVPSTKHYSWPKGAAIMGIGSGNAVSVGVDNNARVDMVRLEHLLNESLSQERPVYSVVAVIGSTEEGAVDPLREILALRQKFQAKGLSFIVHGDAAWGGYFATMLPRATGPVINPGGGGVQAEDITNGGRDGGVDGLVPDLSLRLETQEDLFALRYCDSITVDPHKAGYIPYPAGALTYRDGRIKNLVTWTSPYLSRGSVTSIGIYGVEGSKPGASAMSTWLSNQCVGLDQQGYGSLLSEACFTSSRLSALWAALSTDKDSFICVPFNALPSEASNSPKAIELERQRIRDEILTKSNAEIVTADKNVTDPAKKTMTLLRKLGSDLNINAFALNWKYPDGKINTDVEEANYLMTRVVSRMSVDNPDDKPNKIPLYLTSTEFSLNDYGHCATNFKKRLGLDTSSSESLMVLRNVVMSPLATFTSKGDFVNMLGETFRQIVVEEVKVCQARNENTPDYHSFWPRSSGNPGHLFLSYRPMFHLAKHRRQILLEARFANEADAETYGQVTQNTEEDITLKTSDKIDLAALLEGGGGEFVGSFTTKSNGAILPRVPLQITSVLKNRSLTTTDQDDDYPSGLCPFYIYGSLPPSSSTGGETPTQVHIDHILTKSPNIFMSASVEFKDLSGQIPEEPFHKGGILALEGVHEAALQPFPETEDELGGNFFFRAGKEFKVKIWEDPRGPTESGKGLIKQVTAAEPIATGTVVIKGDEDGKHDGVVVDLEKLNQDPWHEKEDDKVGRWRERFAKIGKELGPRDLEDEDEDGEDGDPYEVDEVSGTNGVNGSNGAVRKSGLCW
ncbi:pyridoxal phosphate-dependent transferase [Podospora australis]|uniref:Pyridoxal phosphate-dependent transferase n=1 Tax=Podospora australis TaxID=1536484 RepID=A0AAN6WQ55_9PEZI|nr:pyridoxal phosphate-dependent transferase [Podospora australis]